MRTKRWMATCVVALLSVTAVLAKDIRVGTFHRAEGQNRVHHLRCRKDRREETTGRIQEIQLRGRVCEGNQAERQERRQTRI